MFTDEELRPFGYAPGKYMVKCFGCKTVVMGLDKRALHCRDCASPLALAALRAERNSLQSQLTEAAVLLADLMSGSKAKCTWEQDDVGSDMFGTSCGNYFALNDGTPSENKMSFCPFCGGKIIEDLCKEEG